MKKLSCIIVGAGHRALLYASYAKEHPEEMAVTGVVDPAENRRKLASGEFSIAPSHCFESVEELSKHPKMADFAINGTMDSLHVPTTIPLLRKGYDVLIEKPIASSEEGMWELLRAARETGRKAAVCHVLRHTPFYSAIRREVEQKSIGDIVNIQAAEHVSYHHMGVGYIRGKWNRSDESTILMAKSCHDLDLIAWMKGRTRPKLVASFGGNYQFDAKKSPPGAGSRCLVDCPIEKDCVYSARKHYVDHPSRWRFYVWEGLEHPENQTGEELGAQLKKSPYGKCAWKTDMNVFDHQSVLVEFEDGSTASFNLVGGSSSPSRSIHLIGTRGEIRGCFEDGKFIIRKIDPRPGCEFSERIVDLKAGGDTAGARGGHGGGDLRLIADFLRYLREDKPSLSTAGLEDSVWGHLIGFRADAAARENRVIDIRTKFETAPIGA